MTITHLKISNIPDGSDESQVRPSDWNAGHNIIPDGLIIHRHVYNELPTKLSDKQYQTTYQYLSNSLEVFLNGLKEINVVFDTDTKFSFTDNVDITDQVIVNYIRKET